MTLPYERTLAVLAAHRYLIRMMNPKATPRVSKKLREEARQILKHMPNALDLERPAESIAPTYRSGQIVKVAGVPGIPDGEYVVRRGRRRGQ